MDCYPFFLILSKAVISSIIFKYDVSRQRRSLGNKSLTVSRNIKYRSHYWHVITSWLWLHRFSGVIRLAALHDSHFVIDLGVFCDFFYYTNIPILSYPLSRIILFGRNATVIVHHQQSFTKKMPHPFGMGHTMFDLSFLLQSCLIKI